MDTPTRSMTADERLDETIIESFPASDPPPYWAGTSGSAPEYKVALVLADVVRRGSPRTTPDTG